MHSLSLDSASVLSTHGHEAARNVLCSESQTTSIPHSFKVCHILPLETLQRENRYKMTVQSQVNGAVSQSVGAAQDLLQWHPNKSESMKALAAFLLIPLFLGQIVGLLSATQIKGWYKNIRKPSWQPPAFLFGPVWSVLYILMGVGAWQVWKHGGWAAQKDALSLWVFQLIFNLFWNPLFFLKHDMSLALFDIGGMHLNSILSQILC
ncbi:TPA: hypothetical protein ACH3X3_004286 [Trebouxia sp. C0006]